MVQWQGKTALVTGAGSGIGQGIAQELCRRGVKVLISDVDLGGLQKTKDSCQGGVEAASLDVRDFQSFQGLCQQIVKNWGSLDFLFNNAGLGICGEVFEIGLDGWQRIIDVNIRGVVNGVHAAYPIMVKQQSGHIINTASMAGFGPVPLFTPYAMTKHAIIGLSRSLRLEGERYGVKVSALCPAAIDTPLLDRKEIPGLSAPPWIPDIRRFLTKLAGPPISVEKLVDETMLGIEANLDLIVVPARARIARKIGLWFPGIAQSITRKALESERARRPT